MEKTKEKLTVKEVRIVGEKHEGIHVLLTNDEEEKVHFITPSLDQCRDEKTLIKTKMKWKIFLEELGFDVESLESVDSKELEGLSGMFYTTEKLYTYPEGNYGYMKEVLFIYKSSFTRKLHVIE